MAQKWISGDFQRSDAQGSALLDDSAGESAHDEELVGEQPHFGSCGSCLRLLGWGEHRHSRCEKIVTDAS
jgi:hypothetical protein